MTEGYKTLKKKVQELEARLSFVFSLPPEIIPHHRFSQGIFEQRFLFLKNLLSAEVSSSHPSKPHHLHRIAQRLTELEKTFHEWVHNKTAALINNFETTSSICSCDESGRDDDFGEAFVNDFPDLGSSELVQRTCPERKVPEEEEREEINEGAVKEERGKIYVFAKYCGVFASGMILMGVSMLRLSAYSYSTVHDGFLVTPT